MVEGCVVVVVVVVLSGEEVVGEDNVGIGERIGWVVSVKFVVVLVVEHRCLHLGMEGEQIVGGGMMVVPLAGGKQVSARIDRKKREPLPTYWDGEAWGEN